MEKKSAVDIAKMRVCESNCRSGVMQYYKGDKIWVDGKYFDDDNVRIL